LLVALLWVTACVPAPSTPQKAPSTPEEAIVGQWLNAQGGAIHFYADGTGLIPAVHGEVEDLPPVAFKYLFNDDTHIRIDMGEQGGEQRVIVVEIELDGDKMTWRNPATGVDYVYMRQE
jgi:hypothetical protein